MLLWMRLCKWIAGGAAGVFVIKTVNSSIIAPILFRGESMLPTICPNDIGLCDKRIPFSDIRRGDIVIVTSPKQPSLLLCKRVIGLGGDVVSESKIKKTSNSGYFDMLKLKKSTCIPRGHIWLEGDNKSNSTDSRTYGPVPLGLVKARVIGKVYPFENAALFARESIDDQHSEEE